MSIATAVRPVSVEQTLERSPFTLFSAALLPSHTILPQDALHCFDYSFLCFPCYLFQWVLLPTCMPTSILRLTLFTALAYAAPVAPRGATVKRQCSMVDCRDAVSVGGCFYK